MSEELASNLQRDEYQKALKLGRRFAAERNADGQSGYVPVLDSSCRELCSELSMGLLEIPLKKIRGTYSAGRQAALAGNFMPLLPEGTEFAFKWINVYNAHITQGLRDPVSVYEYMGYYYVREGNKRISVLKFNDAYSFPAEVTRLLPPDAEATDETRIFYELLGGDRRKPIKHMWFSRPGTYTSLLNAANGDAAALEDCFLSFRLQYHALGYAELPLTTGDAFAEYVSVFGFPLGLSETELKKNIKNCAPQFTLTPAEASVVADPAQLEKKAWFSSLFSKSSRISAAFILAGRPEQRYMSAMQDTGRLALLRGTPQTGISVYYADPIGSDAYEVMSNAVRQANPDLLFSADPYMETAALRMSLESKSTWVLQCGANKPRGALSTYYGITAEPAFLCGALASAFSNTGRLGFIPGSPATGILHGDIQAFAQGAKTVRGNAHIFSVTLPEQSISARLDACRALRANGCDMVWLPYLPNTPLESKAFPGVYARIVRLNDSGMPRDIYAAAAWHWDMFYMRLIRQFSEAAPETVMANLIAVPHFRMGLAAGLLRVHPCYPVLDAWGIRLLYAMESLISDGKINPLDEEMTVEVNEL